jgi:predicted RNA-binding Zn-ribbon protein involved in translation (DUF1610 family)
MNKFKCRNCGKAHYQQNMRTEWQSFAAWREKNEMPFADVIFGNGEPSEVESVFCPMCGALIRETYYSEMD